MAVVKPAMELASVQAAVVSEADLKAYDELLAGASRLTLRLAKSKQAFKTFRVDVDGRREVLTILVNFDRDPNNVGKDLRNAKPYNAFFADVLLGDGADGRIVQTVSNPGSNKDSLSQARVLSQSMDRGEALTVDGQAVPYGALNAGCDPFTKCRANEHAMTVKRPGGEVRLAATPALNEATCRRAWCDCILGVPCCAGVGLWFCLAPPTVRYEVQDAARAPLGAARYTEPKYTFLYAVCCTDQQPTGAFADLGTAPLEARRDIIVALAAQIGTISATVASA
jgi:hypothetical protein